MGQPINIVKGVIDYQSGLEKPEKEITIKQAESVASLLAMELRI